MGLNQWGKVAHSCLQSVSCPFALSDWACLCGSGCGCQKVFPGSLLEVEK